MLSLDQMSKQIRSNYYINIANVNIAQHCKRRLSKSDSLKIVFEAA